MRKIIAYLKQHIRDDFHFGLYLSVAVFLSCGIAFNYIYDLEDTIIDAYRGQEIRNLWYFLLYSAAYYPTMVLTCFFRRDWSLFRSTQFWFYSLAAMTMLAIDGSFYYHNAFVYRVFLPELSEYAYHVIANLNSVLTILLPCWLVYQFGKKNNVEFYGLTPDMVDLRPYALMLLIMFPLIFWASFQPDFLSNYPSYSDTSADEYLGVPGWVTVLVFELAYGWDFVATELLFRGFLIIGMTHILGPKTVLPMVVTYAFLHFGKPLGETIGSVFGGYLLGVIALYSRSIWGGIAIHLGVAWLMELAAFIQLEIRP